MADTTAPAGTPSPSASPAEPPTIPLVSPAYRRYALWLLLLI